MAQLYKLSNIQLIQGNFNLHCSYWDEDSNDNLPLAWELIRALHKCQLSLVNDELIPTFYHSNHRPQVLDLIWINDDVISWHGVQLIYNITGPAVDHKTMMLRVGDNGEVMLQNVHLLRQYIPTGSEEEEQFVFFVFEEMAKWDAENPSLCAQQFINSCCVAWDRFSKPGKAQYNCWWNKECRMAKL